MPRRDRGGHCGQGHNVFRKGLRSSDLEYVLFTIAGGHFIVINPQTNSMRLKEGVAFLGQRLVYTRKAVFFAQRLG